MQLQADAFSAPDPDLAGRTILQIVPDLHSGGAERTTIEVAEALAQAGARCLVASRGGRMVSELQSKGGVWLPFPAATKNPVAMALNSVRLARIIRDEGVEIVHARSRAPAWVAHFAARQASVRFVTTWHSTYSGSSAIKRHYNSIMAAGDIVIANSRFSAQRIADLYPAGADRIVIIPRGADLRRFSPAQVEPRRVEALRAAWRIEPHRRIVLLPARLTPRKGHVVAIEAARLLARQGLADARFVFIGDTQSESFRETLEEMIDKAGLRDVVTLPGHCADMPAAYLAAAVVLMPSTEPEAFGRVAIEAQAMGAPVIVADLGAASEIVRCAADGVPQDATGWRAPAGDASALADAIAEALALKASARDELTRRARDHVARRFSTEQMCRATLDVYRRLLA